MCVCIYAPAYDCVGRRQVAVLLLYVKYGTVNIIAHIPKVRDDYVPNMPYLTVLGYYKVYVGL